jgi:hypothetical protein
MLLQSSFEFHANHRNIHAVVSIATIAETGSKRTCFTTSCTTTRILRIACNEKRETIFFVIAVIGSIQHCIAGLGTACLRDLEILTFVMDSHGQ